MGTGGEPDLVEREAHVPVPVERAHHEPQPAVVVRVVGRGKRPRRELTKAVMQPVDHLHGRGGIVLPGAQRALGHVDELPEPVRRVVVVGSLIAEHDEPSHPLAVQPATSPRTRNSVAP